MNYSLKIVAMITHGFKLYDTGEKLATFSSAPDPPTYASLQANGFLSTCSGPHHSTNYAMSHFLFNV